MKTMLLRRVPRTAGLQPLYRRLHTLALAGMNHDAGASVRSSGEENSLAYAAGISHRPTIFDAGANVGEYAARAVARFGDRMIFHAFEPSTEAFDRLKRRVGRSPGVHLHQMALGETAGDSPLFADRPGSEISSLFTGGFDHWDLPIQQRETVRVARLDETCRDLGVRHITLLKLDVEGGELTALHGAGAMLKRRAIDLIQFEFGTAAMGPRVFFRDLYELLAPTYRIHRIVADGLAPVEAYDAARCEIFSTASNYLAVERGLIVPSRTPSRRRDSTRPTMAALSR